MPDITTKIRTSFSIWQDKFDAAYDKFSADLEGQILTLRAQGLSDNVIMGILDRTLNDEVGVFGPFVGDIEKYADDLTSITAQTASNSDFNMDELLDWVLDPTAEHCEGCLERASRPAMTFAEHEAEGLPGSANTECQEYCRCTLEIAEGVSG